MESKTRRHRKRKGSTPTPGMRVLKQPKQTLRHYVPGARLQPGRHRADPTRTPARSCFSPCRTPHRPPQASSTCVCRSAPWRAACLGPRPACGGSDVHILQGKREGGRVTRRERHDFCRRQPRAALGSHTQQKYCFSFCTSHPFSPRRATLLQTFDFPVLGREATQATGPLCCLPEPLGGMLSPCPSPPCRHWPGDTAGFWGVKGKVSSERPPTQQQLTVNDFSIVLHLCCQRGGLLRLSPIWGGN